MGNFRVPKALTLKTRPSTKPFFCENEFICMIIKKSFSQERFCTWPRLKTEGCGISEMAYFEYNAISKTIYAHFSSQRQLQCTKLIKARAFEELDTLETALRLVPSEFWHSRRPGYLIKPKKNNIFFFQK